MIEKACLEEGLDTNSKTSGPSNMDPKLGVHFSCRCPQRVTGCPHFPPLHGFINVY
jgi:hypothetical protein